MRIQTNFDRKEGIVKAEGFIDYSNVKLVEKAAQEKKKSAKSKTSARQLAKRSPNTMEKNRQPA